MLASILLCTICVENYTEGPPPSCRNMYLWYILVLLLSSVKDIFHFKWLIRTLKKSKYRQAKASKRYKHGWEVLRDYAHALQLDVQNGNTKWEDAIDFENEQIKEYQVFKDHGKVEYEKGKLINAPKGIRR